jgi:YqaJ-like viral recombinase domain
MVYSQICTWLDDFLHDDPPEELLDTWDFIRWIQETELIDLFTEYIVPTFKTQSSRRHAIQILMSLLWEFYLFRRAVSVPSCNTDSMRKLLDRKSTVQRSPEWYSEAVDLLTASEFGHVIENTGRRRAVIKNKLGGPAGYVKSIVGFSAMGSTEWGSCFEQVIRQIYCEMYSCTVAELGRIRHGTLEKLAASPDGIVTHGPRAGRLLEIKAPKSRLLVADVVPDEYYCQVQVQMEVCDIELADYCECRLLTGSTWTDCSGSYVGSVCLVSDGEPSYAYSPVFADTAAGRLAAETWTPEEGGVVERCVWQIAGWQVITLPRNRKWWSVVGLPAYQRFWLDVAAARADPMFFAPNVPDFEEPLDLTPAPSEAMFLDDA